MERLKFRVIHTSGGNPKTSPSIHLGSSCYSMYINT